jgi:hypothetical protein
MAQRFYVNEEGYFVGSYDGPDKDMPEWLDDLIEVDSPPLDHTWNWNFSTSEWSSPSTTTQDLLVYSGGKRWEKENGGFQIGGMHIATDDRSKTMITGARIAADANTDFSTPWKTPDGNFTRITAPIIVMISNAMLDHVDACFNKEELISADIVSGAITTTEQIDAAWNDEALTNRG